MKSNNRDDLFLVKINPSIIGQKYGLGSLDIDKVLLATRYKGNSLFPVNEWPLFVHVAILTEGAEESDVLNEDQISSIGFAEIYNSPDTIE